MIYRRILIENNKKYASFSEYLRTFTHLYICIFCFHGIYGPRRPWRGFSFTSMHDLMISVMILTRNLLS